jgi:hypothetical protein
MEMRNAEQGMGMVAEWKWQNENGITGMVAEHGMADYSCSLNK